MAAKSDRLNVKVDTDRMKVYSETTVRRTNTNAIGQIVEYVVNEGCRTPSGGRFTSRRMTVRVTGDDRTWVGQMKAGALDMVRLRPLS